MTIFHYRCCHVTIVNEDVIILSERFAHDAVKGIFQCQRMTILKSINEVLGCEEYSPEFVVQLAQNSGQVSPMFAPKKKDIGKGRTSRSDQMQPSSEIIFVPENANCLAQRFGRSFKIIVIVNS